LDHTMGMHSTVSWSSPKKVPKLLHLLAFLF
jgi:hypothetical protein